MRGSPSPVVSSFFLRVDHALRVAAQVVHELASLVERQPIGDGSQHRAHAVVDEQMLSDLYKTPKKYRKKVEKRARKLVKKRFLLEEDKQKIIDASMEVDFPRAPRGRR